MEGVVSYRGVSFRDVFYRMFVYYRVFIILDVYISDAPFAPKARIIWSVFMGISIEGVSFIQDVLKGCLF